MICLSGATVDKRSGHPVGHMNHHLWNMNSQIKFNGFLCTVMFVEHEPAVT